MGSMRGFVRVCVLCAVALVLPASAWYLILLVAPLAIVVIMSFGTKSKFGGYDAGFTLANYGDALDPDRVSPFVTSISLALGGTILCLLAALPIAYFMAGPGSRSSSCCSSSPSGRASSSGPTRG